MAVDVAVSAAKGGPVALETRARSLGHSRVRLDSRMARRRSTHMAFPRCICDPDNVIHDDQRCPGEYDIDDRSRYDQHS